METIKLNDIEYIKKEAYLNLEKDLLEIKEKLNKLNKTETEVNRFPMELELKLLSLLGKIFQPYNQYSENYLLEKDKLVVDPANVCGVYGKTEQAKRILSRFLDYDTEKDNPKLDYNITGIATSKFSLEYINKILAVLSIDSDAIRFTNKLDFPIKLENQHFAFILAPRVVEGDEEETYKNKP